MQIDEKVMTSSEEPNFVKTLTGAASMAEAEARDEADQGKAWTLNFLAGKLRDASFAIEALTKLRDDKIAMGWHLVPTLSLGTRITLADGTEAVVVPGSIVGLLETLSDAASNLDDKHEDRFDIWECPAAMNITAGDLRAGRAMLSALEAK